MCNTFVFCKSTVSDNWYSTPPNKVHYGNVVSLREQIISYKPNQTEIWETLPGQGGAPEAPLQPILFLKKFWLKNSVVLIHVDSINSYSFFPFSDFFFQKSTKNSKNSKCIKNFCQVGFKWATFHHHSSIWVIE